jgi:hypothetical protein
MGRILLVRSGGGDAATLPVFHHHELSTRSARLKRLSNDHEKGVVKEWALAGRFPVGENSASNIMIASEAQT